MRILKVLIFCGLIALGRHSDAADFGLLTDVRGDVKLTRNGQQKRADIGMNIVDSDSIVLSQGSIAVIVSYDDCREWSLKGPDTVKVNRKLTSFRQKDLTSSRQLPVCYGMDDLKSERSKGMGGYVLRGKTVDPLAELRKEFDEGNASTSTLITLILHDLSMGDAEKARPYYEELKKRDPLTLFIKDVASAFEVPIETSAIFRKYDIPPAGRLKHLCGQRVYGEGNTHIEWDAFASGMSPADLLAYYRERMGDAGFESTEKGGIWRMPAKTGSPDRALSIMSVDEPGPHSQCDKPVPAGSGSIVTISRKLR